MMRWCCRIDISEVLKHSLPWITCPSWSRMLSHILYMGYYDAIYVYFLFLRSTSILWGYNMDHLYNLSHSDPFFSSRCRAFLYHDWYLLFHWDNLGSDIVHSSISTKMVHSWQSDTSSRDLHMVRSGKWVIGRLFSLWCILTPLTYYIVMTMGTYSYNTCLLMSNLCCEWLDNLILKGIVYSMLCTKLSLSCCVGSTLSPFSIHPVSSMLFYPLTYD